MLATYTEAPSSIRLQSKLVLFKMKKVNSVRVRAFYPRLPSQSSQCSEFVQLLPMF